MFIKLNSNGDIIQICNYFNGLFLCAEASAYSVYLDRYGYIYIEFNESSSNLRYYDNSFSSNTNGCNEGKIRCIGNTNISYYDHSFSSNTNSLTEGKIRSIGNTHISYYDNGFRSNTNAVNEGKISGIGNNYIKW